MINPKLITVLNKQLKNRTFDFRILNLMNIKVRLEINGQKEMISVGDLKDYLTYTVYILATGDQQNDKILNTFLDSQADGKKEINVRSYDMSPFQFLINSETGDILAKLASFIKDDVNVIINKIVNQIDSEKINESLIRESRYDGITRKLVKDIIVVYKENDNGDFTLPEYFDEEMTYNFGAPADDLTVNLILKKNINTDEFEVTGSYTRENNTITIVVIYNPDKKVIITQKLIGELNENVRHELEHMIQKWKGSRFRKEPETPIKYYTQKKEIEAQVAGFKRRAKQEKRPVEDVMREWFKKYQHRHSLEPKEVEKVIKRLLDKFSNDSSNNLI